MERASGILMHITSLPEAEGIGTFGKCAYEFVDFLKAAGQRYWQILPIGPTGYGHSPYQAFSAFAGNPYLIDLRALVDEGLLEETTYASICNSGNDSKSVDFEKVVPKKMAALKEAYEKADRMMKEMQSKAAALVEKIQKEDNKKEDIKNVQKSLNMLRSALQSDKSKTVIEKPKVARKVDFKVGERVFVNSLNQFANVLKINLSKETTQVQAGILKLEVSLDDVKVVEEKKQKVYNSFSHKKTAVRSEIDLRGKMVDEAVYELETYLDRAIMNSYNEVYVIHGKGTGALREGILNYLKKCPYVKEYRIGGHGEGGLGCTVVTLK